MMSHRGSYVKQGILLVFRMILEYETNLVLLFSRIYIFDEEEESWAKNFSSLFHIFFQHCTENAF